MHADVRRMDPRESASIGGFIPPSINHASRRDLDRCVNFVATKWPFLVVAQVPRRILYDPHLQPSERSCPGGCVGSDTRLRLEIGGVCVNAPSQSAIELRLGKTWLTLGVVEQQAAYEVKDHKEPMPLRATSPDRYGALFGRVTKGKSRSIGGSSRWRALSNTST
jgi:hypothetical protein